VSRRGRRLARACAVLGVGVVALSLAATTAWPQGSPPPTTPSPSTPKAPSSPPGKAAAGKSPPKKPPPVTRLEVAVADPQGHPVEGAFVLVRPVFGAFRPFGGGLDPAKLRSTVTGRDGKARLESLPPGPWDVTVRARGFVPRPLSRVASGPLAVRLEKGGSITGVVRDAESRAPVADAEVAIEGFPSLPGGWEEDASRVETPTDARGRFRLEGIGRSAVDVTARAPGYGAASKAGVRAGETVEIFLFPGATLSGTVKDDDGRPVRGAVVRAQGDRQSSTSPSARTDARGAFVLAGIPPGEYVVVAREGGRAPGVGSVVVEPRSEAAVELVVSDGGYATGRIVDPEGRPLAGKVRAEVLDGEGLPSFASDLMSAEARADGTFALGPLPIGTLGLAVSAPGRTPVRVEASVPARGRTADLGDVVLETGLVIRGRATDREGVGLPGVAVRALRRVARLWSQGEAESGGNGEFTVGGLDAGRYEVTASAPGYAPARASAEAGGDPVELVLDAGGEVAGRVVDADGQPVEEASVLAQATDAPYAPGFGDGSGVADEGEGAFAVRDLAAGTYVLQVGAPGRGEATLRDVRVVAGRTTDVGTIVLARGGAIRGTVVDADGEGVPGATVTAERDVSFSTGQLAAQTGTTGAFEIRGVPPGTFSVTAEHPAFATSPPQVAAVDPDREPKPLRFVLRQGGRIEGQALHRDGRPFVGGRVNTYSLEPDSPGYGREMAPVGPDGWFTIERVPPGRRRVSLMAYAPSGTPASGGSRNLLTGVASRDVEVRDGEAAPVTFELRDVVVSGQVTRGGQPAPGIRVSLTVSGGSSVFGFSGPAAPGALIADAGPPPLAAATGPDGRYELLVFAPGRARVRMTALAGGQSYPGEEVEIPDVERFELNLELAEASVSGIVVRRESGEPVADVRLALVAREPQGKWAGSGTSGPDGRFTITAEPGEYQLRAEGAGWRAATVPVTVASGGSPEVRVEMEPGATLTGRVVDEGGRGVPGVDVEAAGAEAEDTAWTNALGDGTFRVDGLGAGPYTLVAGSALAGFAVRGGIVPGEEPVTLRLEPAGRIAVRVLREDGRPVKDAYPSVRAVGGLHVELMGLASGPTNESGVSELPAPAGTVEVEVRDQAATGRATVTVRPRETVPLDVVVKEAPSSR
jgi:protocatechuate 3,4-dioxygenase beta subunit